MKSEILILAVVFLSLVCFMACKPSKNNQNIKDKQALNNTNNTKQNEFPWNNRTTLVFYAGHSLNDNPDENFPHLILKEYDEKANFLIVDGTPYLSVLTTKQMLKELANYKTTKKNAEQQIIQKIEEWVNARSKEGYNSFLYEMEPPELAGKAYPIAKAAEKE